MYLLPSWWLITFLLCAIVLLGSTQEGGLEYSMCASTFQSGMGTQASPVFSQTRQGENHLLIWNLGVNQISVGKAERSVGGNLEWKKIMSRTLK